MSMWRYLRVIIALFVLLVLVTSACGAEEPAAPDAADADDDAVDVDDTEEVDDAADVEETVSEGDLEVFSWWTSGGEAAALDAIFDVYLEQEADVEIVNAAVAGGGGTAAKPVLQTRLAGGDPPDTWQTPLGHELFDTYVDPGFVEAVTFLYEENDWYDVIPDDLLGMMERDGEIYAVVLGVHRGNGFWYNKPALADHGIEIGETIDVDEWFDVAEQLEAEGVTPLCMGDTGIWASVEMFENTLAGVLGADDYRALWNGELAFDSPQVREAIEIYGGMLDYQNEDHSSLSWDQAIERLIEGECMFNSMGDWAYGEFVAAGLEDDVDFGWVSHPGTDGIFVVVVDSFTLAEGAPNRDNTVSWLRAVGSTEGQEEFNPLKGSIPPRTDVDRDVFGMYHEWAMDSFANDELVETVVHGIAAPAGFMQEMDDATTAFVTTRDVDAYASALQQAAETHGLGE